VSIAIVCLISYKPAQILDLKAAMTYQRALLINGLDNAMHDLRAIINPRVKYHFSKIDAWTSHGLYAKDVEVRKIVSSSFFIKAYSLVTKFLYTRLLMLLGVMSGILLLIYLIWSRFGKDVSSEKHISGARIKTAKEVANYLRSIGKVSYLKIADMPLVKDAETKHIIITGTTGSGKTNLINNIVPQIIKAAHPALVVDQTGEMIARYYDASRGDIIFNPLDARSHSWDFWTDNSASDIDDNNTNSRLEKFAKVLFKYGKKPHSNSDPFWDNSAQIIFCACVEHLITTNNKSIAQLCYMLNSMPLKSLAASLVATKVARYLTNANSITANSILSVMTTNTKPLNLLRESARQFSLKQYFTGVKNNNPAWLFL
jgi:type IV secretory pathway TraG/TraD family ATPase VirD4